MFLDRTAELIGGSYLASLVEVRSGSGVQITSGLVQLSSSSNFELSVPLRDLDAIERSEQTYTRKIETSTESALSISDVIMQLRHIVGLETLDTVRFAAADNDADGSVSILMSSRRCGL